MKRLAFAFAVIGLVACKKAETPPPAQDTTMPPAAAPAPTDTMKADTMKMDTTQKGE